MRKALFAPAVAIAAAAFPLLTMTAASAADQTSYQADLGSTNDSGVTGTAMVTLDGDQATVQIEASGLLPGSPHAQHIHIGGAGTCPTPANDKDGDGFVSVTEAAANYGAIAVSLTTSGDSGPDSGLAIDRFPADGTVTYNRTVTVSQDVATNLANGTAVVVLHGVDKDGDGAYGGSVMSDLDPSLPMEATAPAACGALQAAQMSSVPNGAADTGAGATAGVENSAMIGVGALALAGAGAAGAIAYRRRADSQA